MSELPLSSTKKEFFLTFESLLRRDSKDATANLLFLMVPFAVVPPQADPVAVCSIVAYIIGSSVISL